MPSILERVRSLIDDVDEPLNLALRLAARERAAPPPGAAAARARRLFENVAPSQPLAPVDPPPGLCLCRFTPCGRFLVSFDALRNEAVVHRVRGYARGERGGGGPPPPATAHGRPAPAAAFGELFAPHLRLAVAAAPDEALLPFCLVAHGSLLLLASATAEARRPGADGWAGVAERTTLHVVRLSDGVVTARHALGRDVLELGRAQAASLYGDLLLLLGVASQSLTLLRLSPDGELTPLQTLGRHCCEDDSLEVAKAEEAEQRYRAAEAERRGAPPAAAGLGEGSAAASGATHALRRPRDAPSSDEDNDEDVGDDEGESGGPPRRRRRLARGGRLIEGLRQRMLAFMYTRAAAAGAAAGASHGGGPGAAAAAAAAALRPFHYFFDAYASLLMVGAQLLDARRVLIEWAPPALVPGAPAPPRGAGAPPAGRRGGGPALRCVYDLAAARVEAVLEGAAELERWAARHPAAGHGGAPAAAWDRFAAAPAASRAAREAAAAAAAPPHAPPHHPPGAAPDDLLAPCQARGASPYLDPELYSFDARAVGADGRPRAPPHRALKFIARRQPERLRFFLDAEHVCPRRPGVGGAGAPAGGAAHRQVVYLFHPGLPLVVAAVEDRETGQAERLAVYARVS